MHSNYRLFCAALVPFITTAFVSAQKPLENTTSLWETVERSDEASVKALLSQGGESQ